jgi:hypothetical protein
VIRATPVIPDMTTGESSVLDTYYHTLVGISLCFALYFPKTVTDLAILSFLPVLGVPAYCSSGN